jgi:RNA polymerase sigma-70 factor (ECF subfamily)
VSRRDDPLDAIEAVYRERYASFVRLAAAITRNEQQALDAVHDGFVRAVRHRASLRDVRSAAGWIAQIVLNEARKRVVAETRYVSTDEPLATAAANGHRARGALEAAVAALPERQRHALFLRYYADLEYSDIGEALGMAPGTVSATLNAARNGLRKALEEVEPWTI